VRSPCEDISTSAARSEGEEPITPPDPGPSPPSEATPGPNADADGYYAVETVLKVWKMRNERGKKYALVKFIGYDAPETTPWMNLSMAAKRSFCGTVRDGGPDGPIYVTKASSEGATQTSSQDTAASSARGRSLRARQLSAASA